MPAQPRHDNKHKVLPSQVLSPPITRITLPSSSNSSERGPAPVMPYSSASPNGSSSYDDDVPPANDSSLDDLWGSLRDKKSKRMAKERPKVQSLEQRDTSVLEYATAIEIPETVERSPPPPKSDQKPPPPQLKRQKSLTSFRESPDGRTMVASFDMRDIPKENVHVSFQRHRLVVSWGIVEVSELEENGVLVRERSERNYQRTLPLPEGTRFEEITGAMSGRHLLIRYPNSRSFRVENRSNSGGS